MTEPTKQEVLEQLDIACRYLYPDRPPNKAFDMAKALIERWQSAFEAIIDADTLISDGGKVHDHGPCAQIAIDALASVGSAPRSGK